MVPWDMRRTTTFAVLLSAAAVLVTGAAGLSVVGSGGRDRVEAAGGLAIARTVVTTAPDSSDISAGAPPPPTQPRSVTVPALPTTEAPPIPPPGAPAAGSLIPAEPLPAPAPAPAPASAVEPAPALPPADAPVRPPYATVLGWHGDGRVAYLTFDDGPGPYTAAVLDILAAAGVRATFCQVGQKVTENPAVTQRVVADGHTLCNHSWDHHSPFDALPPDALDAEIGQAQNAFLQSTGVTVKYLRAPEGRFGDPGGPVLQAAQRAGTVPLGWGVDSLDWRKPGPAAIVATVLTTVSPGAIILLHDGGGVDREQTIAALPGIISGLQAQGYSLLALPPDPTG